MFYNLIVKISADQCNDIDKNEYEMCSSKKENSKTASNDQDTTLEKKENLNAKESSKYLKTCKRGLPVNSIKFFSHECIIMTKKKQPIVDKILIRNLINLRNLINTATFIIFSCEIVSRSLIY